jgi:hypothetical protein
MSDNKQKLIQNYKETLYSVDGLIDPIQIDHKHRELDHLLVEKSVTTWAYITAWNPKSERRDDSVNFAANEKLKQDIRAMGYETSPGVGRDHHETWHEDSFLVLGISKEEAIELGKKYEQNAIVVGKLNQPAELVLVLLEE